MSNRSEVIRRFISAVAAQGPGAQGLRGASLAAALEPKAPERGRCQRCGRYRAGACPCGHPAGGAPDGRRAPWIPRTLGGTTHRVLFVGASGRCQAPVAAALADQLVVARGLPVTVRAAALAAGGGAEAHPLAARAAAEIGLDLAPFGGRVMSRADVLWAGAIVTLTGELADAVIAREPEAVGKVIVIGELDDLGDMRDPPDDDPEGFRRCREALRSAVEGFVDRLPVAAYWPASEPG